MEIPSNQSTLEILPDEILLEVCKYLLCVDILQAFFGLNSRMSRMITQYRHHVSLHKATISQSSYVCINVLPQIGAHIRSLLIERCYSVLQNDLFIKYFGKKMSSMFPRLEKISLIAFRHEHLLDFLDTLHNLDNLVEISLNNLFDINRDHQATALQALLQANSNQLTSVFIDDDSSCLSFNDLDCYVNILRLRIKMQTIRELPSLFATVPNVRYLDVILQEGDGEHVFSDKMHISSLLHLIDFRLKSTKRWWKLEELFILFNRLPSVQTLSLFLCTNDLRLVHGNILLPLLLPVVQQFNYAMYFAPRLERVQEDAIVASWLPSHSILCFPSDTFWFMHTLPWFSARLPVLPPIGKTMSSRKNPNSGYNGKVKHLEIVNNKNFTMAKSLAIIAQCCRMTKLSVWVNTDGDVVQEEQQPPPPPQCLPQLSRLIHIQFCASLNTDIDQLSFILIAAPNLFRLDLPFDCIIRLLENQQMCHLLQQHIMSLAILNATESSQVKFNEEHILLIASSLTGLRDLYVNLSHLPATTATTSNEIMPLSMESIIPCLLYKFKEHKLISLCLDIQPSDKIKTDAKRWLQDNTILCEQQFDAKFDGELNRLFIWM